MTRKDTNRKGSWPPINLLAEDHSRAADKEHRLVIEAYGYRWYRVGGLDYLLRRAEIDEPVTAKPR